MGFPILVTWHLYIEPPPWSYLVTIWYIHPPKVLVIQRPQSWPWMIDSHLQCSGQLALPFFRYVYFKIWPWKYKVKVMGVIKGQGHLVCPASKPFNFFSFQFNANWTNHSSDMAKRSFDRPPPPPKKKKKVHGSLKKNPTKFFQNLKNSSKTRWKAWLGGYSYQDV